MSAKAIKITLCVLANLSRCIAVRIFDSSSMDSGITGVYRFHTVLLSRFFVRSSVCHLAFGLGGKTCLATQIETDARSSIASSDVRNFCCGCSCVGRNVFVNEECKTAGNYLCT